VNNFINIIEKTEEGLNNLKGKPNHINLLLIDKLIEIQTNVENYKKSNDIGNILGLIRLFHETSGPSLEGANVYDTTIWNANIEVSGKLTTLDDLFCELEKEYEKYFKEK